MDRAGRPGRARPRPRRCSTALLQRQPHPRARRLPPRPGAVDGPRLRHHRLRGRAGAAARRSGGSSARPPADVAGMLRSFHYAAYAALFRESGRDAAVGGAAEAWAKHWRALGVGGVPAGLPGGRRPGRRSCPRTTTSSPACSTCTCSRRPYTSSATSSTTGPTGWSSPPALRHPALRPTTPGRPSSSAGSASWRRQQLAERRSATARSLRRAFEQIRSQERVGLARELHDMVAHHVSAIAVQAQVGRTLAQAAP